jgi:hypothetical protein
MRVQWLDIEPAGGGVVALLIALIGCGVASERGGAFPTFPVLAPVNVFEQAEGGEHLTVFSRPNPARGAWCRV